MASASGAKFVTRCQPSLDFQHSKQMLDKQDFVDVGTFVFR
jgi:hypothetical protein